MVGVLILAAIASLAVWVWMQQSHFHPAILSLQPAPPAAAPALELRATPAWTLASFAPPGLAPLSAPETFDAETLSDKIDGRADLYLTAGFVSLRCQRFADATNRAAWFEVFVYDMAAPRNAFAVYSVQRREDAEELKLGAFAYRTPNGLFFVHGRHYVEVVASETSDALMAPAENLSRRFVGMTPAESADLPELALLPAEGLVPGSVILYRTAGFGFDRFQDLFAAAYRDGELEVTAFLLADGSATQAVEQAKAYAEFLVANGGVEEPAPNGLDNAQVLNLFGTYEIVFGRGPVVAGVHQVESREAAERVARRLFDALPGTPP